MASCGGFNKQVRRCQQEEQKEEPKSIWIRASIRERAKDELQYAWFRLNPEDPKLISGSLVLGAAALPPMPHTFLGSAAFAISGSRIYVLGGDWGPSEKKASADLFYIELDGNKGTSSWIEGPPMLCPRAKPACIIVDGKVYVFGGLSYQLDEKLPFGEVFDPKINKWHALPQIPVNKWDFSPQTKRSLASRVSVTAATGAKRYILVHSSVLMFYCLDHSWLDDETLIFERSSRQLVVVDDVIYAIHGDSPKDGGFPISAYHLSAKERLLVHGNVMADVKSRLIYVGGNKFWMFTGGTPECHFVQFEVRKNFMGPDLDSISITSVSSRKFLLDADGFDDILAAA